MSQLHCSYDAVGNITRVGLSDATDAGWVFGYDAQDRLVHEERRGALDEMLWYRLYQYDPAGNRTRLDWFDGSVMRSSTYAYNALNQLTSLLGAAQGERHDVRYDANGNLTRYDHDEDGQATTRYGWTMDDRLAWAQVPGAGGTVGYVYDASGARILRRAPDGTRQRYFFHGLTEEVTKQSVAGVASDTAFGMVERCTGALVPSQWYAPAGTLTSVHDTARRSEVIRLAAGSYAHHGRDYRGGGAAYDYAVTDKRVVSLWVRSAGDAEVVVTVQSSGGLRGLRYCLGGPPQGAPVLVQGNLAYFATTLSTGGGWHRLERDMASDVAAAWPGETLVSAKGLTLAPYTAEPMFVDDVRFSNGATVEHNVLGPGEVAHILRSRTTTVAGGAYAPADAWFAFDQVGSVVNHSNAAGAMTQAVEMDAWGNTLASAASGAWATDQTGWKHSTKRLDPLAGVTYAHARWSDVRVGTWLSQEPTGADGPNLYWSLGANPALYFDSNGLEISISPHLSQRQKDAIMGMLNGIRNSHCTCAAIVNQLESSPRIHVITMSSNAQSQSDPHNWSGATTPGVGSGSTINISPACATRLTPLSVILPRPEYSRLILV